jgi:hypothetical protein
MKKMEGGATSHMNLNLFHRWEAAVMLSSEESYFNSRDYNMSSDEEPIERRPVHRGMKNMFEPFYIYTTTIRLIQCLSSVI